MSELWRRLLCLVRRGRLNRELEEEMQFHLDMKARQNHEAGLADLEAQYAARRQFGNATLLKERSTEVWGWASIERVGQYCDLFRCQCGPVAGTAGARPPAACNCILLDRFPREGYLEEELERQNRRPATAVCRWCGATFARPSSSTITPPANWACNRRFADAR